MLLKPSTTASNTYAFGMITGIARTSDPSHSLWPLGSREPTDRSFNMASAREDSRQDSMQDRRFLFFALLTHHDQRASRKHSTEGQSPTFQALMVLGNGQQHVTSDETHSPRGERSDGSDSAPPSTKGQRACGQAKPLDGLRPLWHSSSMNVRRHFPMA